MSPRTSFGLMKETSLAGAGRGRRPCSTGSLGHSRRAARAPSAVTSAAERLQRGRAEMSVSAMGERRDGDDTRTAQRGNARSQAMLRVTLPRHATPAEAVKQPRVRVDAVASTHSFPRQQLDLGSTPTLARRSATRSVRKVPPLAAHSSSRRNQVKATRRSRDAAQKLGRMGRAEGGVAEGGPDRRVYHACRGQPSHAGPAKHDATVVKVCYAVMVLSIEQDGGMRAEVRRCARENGRRTWVGRRHRRSMGEEGRKLGRYKHNEGGIEGAKRQTTGSRGESEARRGRGA